MLDELVALVASSVALGVLFDPLGALLEPEGPELEFGARVWLWVLRAVAEGALGALRLNGGIVTE